jgi:hypothetical protein
MSSAIIKDTHISFNGISYFRGGSENQLIATYGEKKQPITRTNYLDPMSNVPFAKLKIKEAIPVEIDFKNTTKNDFLSNISIAGVFKSFSGSAWEASLSGEVQLIKLSVYNEDMKDAINQSPKVITDLVNYGNNARVVTQVFIVEKASIAKNFTSSTSFSVSVELGILKITGSGGSSSSASTSVTVAKGSVFAYLLGKFDWNANTKKNQTQVVKVSTDQWSFS